MDASSTIKDSLDGIRSAVNAQVEAAAVGFYDDVRLEVVDSSYAPFLGAVSGGKRFRALCAAVGAAVAHSVRRPTSTATELLTWAASSESVQALMTSLEFYQASALVHDDLLDDADTRRGLPAAHVFFADEHARESLWGDRSEYGRDGAVLLGDLLLSAAEANLARALPFCGPKRAGALLNRFALMTGEVAVGQWADTSLSYHPLNGSRVGDKSVKQAIEVVSRKSGRYSILHPAVLGSLVAGGGKRIEHALEAVLEPTGIAFQLRDDALGAFGEPGETGKPVGSDIEERKRTVLLAITLSRAPHAQAERLEELYASARPTPAEVEEARAILQEHGRSAHESLISELSEQALCALDRVDLPDSAKDLLAVLVDRVTTRRS